MNLDYFKKINNAYGSSGVQETQRQEIKQQLSRDFYNTLDAYKAKIGESDIDLTILKTVDANIKKIKSMPDQTFQYGDVIEWHDCFWLVTEKDTNDDVITHGRMTECNYKLKWQDEEGNTIERWIVTQNASSYSNGTEGNKTIEVGADQLLLLIPYDAETVKLRRGKRFFIDNNTVNPIPYELTRPDSTSFVKNGHGYLSCIVTESQTKTETDRVDLMLCDYIEPIGLQPQTYGLCEISCKYDTIKSGGSTRKYVAKFYDINGCEVNSIAPVWDINCDFMDSLDVAYGNELQISINDDSKIGLTFKIKLSCDGYEEVEKVITVVSLY